MPIDRERLLSLWNLEDIPVCDEGMKLAKTFLDLAFTAVDRLDEADPIALRFAFIGRKPTRRPTLRRLGLRSSGQAGHYPFLVQEATVNTGTGWSTVRGRVQCPYHIHRYIKTITRSTGPASERHRAASDAERRIADGKTEAGICRA
jgi:hypothetical protein